MRAFCRTLTSVVFPCNICFWLYGLIIVLQDADYGDTRPVLSHVRKADSYDCMNDVVAVTYGLAYVLDAVFELSAETKSPQLVLNNSQYPPCPVLSLRDRPGGDYGGAGENLVGDMNEQVLDFCYLPDDQASQLVKTARLLRGSYVIVIF